MIYIIYELTDTFTNVTELIYESVNNPSGV